MLLPAAPESPPARPQDAVTVAFGACYMPHLAQALLQFRRVLRPSGTLLLSTWGPREEVQWIQALANALERVDPGSLRHVQPWVLGDTRHLVELLGESGFMDATVRDLNLPMKAGQRARMLMLCPGPGC